MTRPIWQLDPTWCFLNHGSFGACPTAILEVQDQLRRQMERQGVRFMLREAPALLDQARRALAEFVGVSDADGLAFVPNATTGVNTVLASLELRPGDELLTTNHDYPACRNALEHVASRSSSRVVVADVPFPLEDPGQVVEAIMRRVTSRTRLALVDHVTSPTGLIMPLEQLLPALAERSVQTLVDGAHAPGMLDLSIDALAPTYYTGNCHKWLCTPKGSAFLYVAAAERARVRPLVISHGARASDPARSRYRQEMDWTGTIDPTAVLCIPEAIRYLATLDAQGWPGLRARNRALALRARSLLGEAIGVTLPAPEEMIGALCTVPLPGGDVTLLRPPYFFDPLQDQLFERQIEVPVFFWPRESRSPERYLRVATQHYNSEADVARLIEALRQLHAI